MSDAAVNRSPIDAGVPGWYGKMPNVGDFVSRRLPDAFIGGWDDWLQHGLSHARTQLGEEDWLARYLVAPVRRFWLAPHVLGRGGWSGVLMPSVDRVGRHFPLTIAASTAAHGRGLAAALAAHDWFAAIDSAARKVLDTEFTTDDFERELAQVAAPTADGGADAQAQQLADALLGPYARSGKTVAVGAVRPCSVWWCGDALQPSQFECFATLPPASSFAELLAEPG